MNFRAPDDADPVGDKLRNLGFEIEAATDDNLAVSAPTFRARMTEVVRQSEQLLNASRTLLAAAEKQLQAVRDAARELEP